MELVQPIDLRLKSETPLTAYKWTANALKECAPVPVRFAGITSVQVDGDFDGGYVDLLGTLDGENFFPLADNDGRALTFTSEGVKTVGDAIIAIKPSLELGEKGQVEIIVVTGSAA